MADSPRLVVDPELCLGTGTCMTYAPATIGIDAAGKAVVAEPSADDPDSLLAAAESCPMSALTLVGAEVDG